MSKIDTVFSLKRPFPALWLRFQINDGIISPSGRLCWHLTLFGCPIEEGISFLLIANELTCFSFLILVRNVRNFHVTCL